MPRLLTTAALAVATLLAARGGEDRPEEARPATSALPRGSEAVDLDPEDFSADIDNRYWPMSPGTR